MEKMTMEKLVSYLKERGFVYQGSEIYGGLANAWDYGPLGVELKNNIKRAWWKKFVQDSEYNVGLDAAILMNTETWVASGHIGGFSDPLIDCKQCHSRYRADKLIEEEKRKKAFKIIEDFENDAENIEKLLKKPNNIMIGKLPVGEDFPMRVLAEIANAPFLSKEALKIYCIPSLSQISFIFPATSITSSSDSITQGPAIRANLLFPPISILSPTFTTLTLSTIFPPYPLIFLFTISLLAISLSSKWIFFLPSI